MVAQYQATILKTSMYSSSHDAKYKQQFVRQSRSFQLNALIGIGFHFQHSGKRKNFLRHRETTLERADFQASWSRSLSLLETASHK